MYKFFLTWFAAMLLVCSPVALADDPVTHPEWCTFGSKLTYGFTGSPQWTHFWFYFETTGNPCGYVDWAVVIYQYDSENNELQQTGPLVNIPEEFPLSVPLLPATRKIMLYWHASCHGCGAWTQGVQLINL